MRTFAELLTQYMARTGISDSELARTLGVRRQTIFRWKEGLVEKPRNREDVLACAARLRLTPEERDELLLAAGFPPESRQPTAIVGQPSPSESGDEARSQTEAAEASKPALVPATAATSRRAPKWIYIAAGATILIVLVSGVLFLPLLQEARQSYPAANRGESLIVIGPLGNPARSPAGAESRNYEISDRLQAALLREIQAARLERVRIATWPEEIRDGGAAETVRRRAGASIVIGGASSGDALDAVFSASPAAVRADDLSLDALVWAPSDLQLRIDAASSQEVQSLALLSLSQLYLERGDFDKGRAALTSALARPPADSDAQAILQVYLGYLNQISRPPELEQAAVSYGRAISLSDGFAAFLNRGIVYLRQSESSQWQSDLRRALELQPGSVNANLALCWAFILDSQPDRALSYCDAAVSRSPDGRTREARGVAYAELGRLSEAAAELQSFQNWLSQQPEQLRSRYGSSRADWVQTLKAGRNPIDQTILDKLRRE